MNIGVGLLSLLFDFVHDTGDKVGALLVAQGCHDHPRAEECLGYLVRHGVVVEGWRKDDDGTSEKSP